MILRRWKKKRRHAVAALVRWTLALYSMLKDLRKKLSKKLEVPPYVIVQDPFFGGDG